MTGVTPLAKVPILSLTSSSAFSRGGYIIKILEMKVPKIKWLLPGMPRFSKRGGEDGA